MIWPVCLRNASACIYETLDTVVMYSFIICLVTSLNKKVVQFLSLHSTRENLSHSNLTFSITHSLRNTDFPEPKYVSLLYILQPQIKLGNFKVWLPLKVKMEKIALKDYNLFCCIGSLEDILTASIWLQSKLIRLMFFSLQHVTIQQLKQSLTFTVWGNHTWLVKYRSNVQ